MALEDSFFTSPTGTKLHYVETGDSLGTIILGLHGLGGSTSTFEPLLQHIPKGYRTVLLDFPGFGNSTLSSPERRLSIDGHVTDLDHFVTHLQGTCNGKTKYKFIILGHSLGAIVAMHYTAKAPQNVAGLFLLGPGQSAAHIPAVRQRMLDTATNARKQGIAFAAEQAAQTNFPSDDQRPVNPEHRSLLKYTVAMSDPEGYAQTCEALVGLDHKDPDYSKIKCPTVFIAGDLDTISPVERSNRLKSLFGGQSKVEIVKSGHQPILEDTTSVAVALLKLLDLADCPR